MKNTVFSCMFIYLVYCGWSVLHITCNSICSASAQVPKFLVSERSRERWKEKRFCMFSLYLSCLQLFVAKNIKLCLEMKIVNQYMGEELAILPLLK